MKVSVRFQSTGEVKANSYLLSQMRLWSTNENGT